MRVYHGTVSRSLTGEVFTSPRLVVGTRQLKAPQFGQSYERAKTADQAWLALLRYVLANGTEVSPRGHKTLEVLNYTAVIDMARPVVTNKPRQVGYRNLPGEPWWTLTGDNRLATIAPYCPNMANFSDDGVVLAGAYGPHVVAQLPYVANTLLQDSDSRQAVLTVWKQSPAPSKDIPCTVSLQWLIRDNQLHCMNDMRSSDAWLGWPYDVFNFTMISAYLLLMLRERGYTDLKLGKLFMRATSQHLYEEDWEKAQKALDGSRQIRRYRSFDPTQFNSPEALVTHLKALADKDETSLETPFLVESLHWKKSD